MTIDVNTPSAGTRAEIAMRSCVVADEGHYYTGRRVLIFDYMKIPLIWKLDIRRGLRPFFLGVEQYHRYAMCDLCFRHDSLVNSYENDQQI